MMELKYTLLVVLLLGISIGFSRAEGDDDDHHHDEKQCGTTVDPFDEIKETVNVTEDELSSETLEHVVEHVLERFDCEEVKCQGGHFSAIFLLFPAQEKELKLSFIHSYQNNPNETNIP